VVTHRPKAKENITSVDPKETVKTTVYDYVSKKKKVADMYKELRYGANTKHEEDAKLFKKELWEEKKKEYIPFHQTKQTIIKHNFEKKSPKPHQTPEAKENLSQTKPSKHLTTDEKIFGALSIPVVNVIEQSTGITQDPKKPFSMEDRTVMRFVKAGDLESALREVDRSWANKEPLTLATYHFKIILCFIDCIRTLRLLLYAVITAYRRSLKVPIQYPQLQLTQQDI
jgi:hypothetical protein